MVPQAFDAVSLRQAIVGFHDGLTAHRHAIDTLNVYPVPDGDTGANMMLTMRSVVDGLDGVGDDLQAVCAAVAKGALMGARGNSGVILAQILRGFCGAFSDAGGDGTRIGPTEFADALTQASEGAYRAVARPVEGTILTVVREASEAAREAADAGHGLLEVVDAAKARGRDALERTPQMLSVLAEAGVVDAGGAGLLLMLDACLRELDGRPMPEPPEPLDRPAAAAGAASDDASHGGAESDVADLRYEVMFLLDAADAEIDGFKQAWSAVGDSIVVVGGDGLWNCHIHTDDVGAAIEAGIAVGRPHRIAVTDLLEQAAEHSASFHGHSHGHGQDHGQGHCTVGGGSDPLGASASPPAAHDPVEVTEPDLCSVVAVGAGAGVAEILASMGAHRVVAGGQSMNPSTADLLAAVDSLPSGHAVVLPNNKNIIAVAEQLDGQTQRTVRVVATRSVVEGIASLMAFSPTAGADQNAVAMSAAAAGVTTGEVTQAVRDASSAAGPISAGDWLGIAGDGIAAVETDAAAAAKRLLDVIVSADHELLTVIVGAQARASDTAAIEAHMSERHPHVEVETSYGGQPLYRYYFGLE